MQWKVLQDRGGASFILEDSFIARDPVFRVERKLFSFDRLLVALHTKRDAMDFCFANKYFTNNWCFLAVRVQEITILGVKFFL